MTIKVLLFDIDGVLIDDTKVFYDSIHKHYSLSKEDFMEFYNTDYHQTWVGEIDLKENLKRWLKRWKLETSVDEFLEIWFETENRPNKKLIDFVKQIQQPNILGNKGFKNVFLATTQEKYRMLYILRKMSFNEIAKEAFASYMFKTRKPNENFYEKVFDRLEKYYPDLKPSEILFFDDSLANVTGAKEFGFNAYQYQDFESCKKIIENNLS